MRISRELEGARLNVSETAELLNMESGHFRRLVRRGFFPAPKRTAKGLPYYDHELLCQVGEVMKQRVGLNGEEIMFYRRKPKTRGRPQRRQVEAGHVVSDPYVASVSEGCRQFGVPDQALSPESILAVLGAEFGQERPPLAQAIPVVARRLLSQGG